MRAFTLRRIIMKEFKDYLSDLYEARICKYCGNKTIYAEMIWLNGKCMCPACYIKERAKEDNNAK